jgi:rubrerythrin
MTASEQAMNALGEALKLEQDGYQFYVSAAGQVPQGETRDAFLSLAEEEKVHEAVIVRQMQALREEGAFARVPGISRPEQDLSAQIFPPDVSKAQASAGGVTTELDALQLGMQVEMTSYDYYRQAAQGIDDPDGRDMYGWLAAAELEHFNILMSIYRGINQHANWA